MIYSYYSGSRTYLAAARGFFVRDLLSFAGIDFGSIASIDFFTKEHANGAYRSFTKQSLFDLPRCYFPNLAANEETGELYPYDGDDIWNGASTAVTVAGDTALGTLRLTLRGDVNDDGQADLADVRLLFRAASGAETVSGPAADENGDGRVNNRDAILLFRRIVS